MIEELIKRRRKTWPKGGKFYTGTVTEYGQMLVHHFEESGYAFALWISNTKTVFVDDWYVMQTGGFNTEGWTLIEEK